MALGILMYPLHVKLFYQDYKRGKHSANITNWNFAELVKQPCSLLKLKLYNQI